MTRARALAAAILAAAAVLSGCGSSKDKVGDAIRGRVLTVYSSVPLHGASRVNGEAVVNGETLALAQIHYRLGKYRIAFKSLDDSTPQRGEWDPGQTTVNARLASNDPTTIGYIGDFNSGASAISIPILNRLGIAQISPASTAVGLTSAAPGAEPGEPEKYYPTGLRTYARIVPTDAVQAAAEVQLQESQGCVKTYALDDGEVDGRDTATSFSLAVQRSPVHLAGEQTFDPKATDYSSLAKAIAATGANCVLINALTESNAAQVAKQIAQALPDAKIFGSAGLAESTFIDPAQGGIPIALDPRVMITAPTLDPASYPPSGRAFYVAYTRAYGTPEPSAIYGYEAMSLMLTAISRATGGGRRTAHRSKVVAALFATHDRRSVIGTYSIDRDGDTSMRRYGVFRVVDGRLAFWTAIEA